MTSTTSTPERFSFPPLVEFSGGHHGRSISRSERGQELEAMDPATGSCIEKPRLSLWRLNSEVTRMQCPAPCVFSKVLVRHDLHIDLASALVSSVVAGRYISHLEIPELFE